jgi:hypothetical protein
MYGTAKSPQDHLLPSSVEGQPVMRVAPFCASLCQFVMVSLLVRSSMEPLFRKRAHTSPKVLNGPKGTA